MADASDRTAGSAAAAGTAAEQPITEKPVVEEPTDRIRTADDPQTSTAMNSETATRGETAVIIVDHGSRREESNQMLLHAVHLFAGEGRYAVVEPAHMELAEPSIATAFRRCVERGARQIVVFPYFLSPGRHWSQDIPKLTREAAADFPDVTWLVTAPFGLHPSMMQVIDARIRHCLNDASRRDVTGGRLGCDVCRDSTMCEIRSTRAHQQQH